MTLNDKAWARFFECTSTLEAVKRRGYAYITANDLKKLGGREPRLMAKLDTLSCRPRAFKANNVTIFPVKNGEYILFADRERRSYFEFAKHMDRMNARRYNSRVDLRSFDSYPNSGSLNEAQALDFAFISSILKEFTGDERIQLTIRGRSFSGDFGFGLRDFGHWVVVSSVQIEIDAGYESDESIYLFEAKVGKRDDFHIRQLYYPYLEWSNRSSKQIIPIFFVYSNGKYYLTEFSFGDDFGEMHIERERCYTLNESPTLRVSIPRMLRETPEEEEPLRVPFPQADDLDKVVDTVWAIGEGLDNKDELAEFFEFAERQGDYYANAARYLGFVERRRHSFALTDLGRDFLRQQRLADRTAALLSQMLARPAFRAVFELLMARGYDLGAIARYEIAQIIEAHTVLSGTTPGRRASTVRSWIDWVFGNCEIVF